MQLWSVFCLKISINNQTKNHMKNTNQVNLNDMSQIAYMRVTNLEWDGDHDALTAGFRVTLECGHTAPYALPSMNLKTRTTWSRIGWRLQTRPQPRRTNRE